VSDIPNPPSDEPSSLQVGLIERLTNNRDAPKLIPVVEALIKVGHPWVVSLNFSDEVLVNLLASRTPFRRAVQQRISNYLPDIDASRYVLVLEQFKGRWHLHGIVAYPKDGREKLAAALKKIAGKAVPHQADKALVEVKEVDEQKIFQGEPGIRGWALYIGKSLTASRKALGGSSPLFAPHLTRKLTEEDHDPACVISQEPAQADPFAAYPKEWGMF
jgi:hypothetical protein